MAYLNLTSGVLAMAARQGVSPREFFEHRLALWQHDYGTDEWPERLNVARGRDEQPSVYEMQVQAVFDALNTTKGK